MSAICETKLMERLCEIQLALSAENRTREHGWTEQVRGLDHERHLICNTLREMRQAGVTE